MSRWGKNYIIICGSFCNTILANGIFQEQETRYGVLDEIWLTCKISVSKYKNPNVFLHPTICCSKEQEGIDRQENPTFQKI